MVRRSNNSKYPTNKSVFQANFNRKDDSVSSANKKQKFQPITMIWISQKNHSSTISNNDGNIAQNTVQIEWFDRKSAPSKHKKNHLFYLMLVVLLKRQVSSLSNCTAIQLVAVVRNISACTTRVRNVILKRKIVLDNSIRQLSAIAQFPAALKS